MINSGPSSDRGNEIRKLLALSPEKLIEESEGRLKVLADLDTLYKHFANSIARDIELNNKSGKKTNLILPVGPTLHYPLLAKAINKRGLKLDDCHFFFMDEYCDNEGFTLPRDHPLSFKKEMKEVFFEKLDPKNKIPEEQVIFPNEDNLHEIPKMIESIGGIDTCYGGIGIHGHVAFNEPEPGVENSDPRMVYLNEYTVTINAIRAAVGGDIVNFPNKALTIGMNQIMSSDRIRLYCRNDISGVNWANTVLRLAVLGNPGEDFPVTLLAKHEDYKVITDKRTAEKPQYILPDRYI